MATNRSFGKNFDLSISKGVTLVDFNAPWCKPCRAQEPIISALKKIGFSGATLTFGDDFKAFSKMWPST